MRTCSFCGADPSQVTKLIAGPAPYSVCDACTGLLAEIVSSSEPSDATSPGACSFCGGEDRRLILPSLEVEGHPRTAICYDCVQLCVDVVGSA